MTSRASVAAGIAFAIITSFFTLTVETAAQGKGARSIEGSWLVRLTPASPTPPFDELITFGAGGGITESNNFPFFTLGLSAGPGHGNWRYEGGQVFRFTFLKLLYLPTGQAAGTLKASGAVTYSSAFDTWSGPANVSICDNQGNNCDQIDVTMGEATRISSDD